MSKPKTLKFWRQIAYTSSYIDNTNDFVLSVSKRKQIVYDVRYKYHYQLDVKLSEKTSELIKKTLLKQ